ncbi:hypothetical protein BH24CHL3_BH24CHL3_08420 [soil metagenome]
MSDLFRDQQRDRDDTRQLAAIARENRLNLKALFFTLAIVISPFLALLFSLELALFVLASGLLFSTVLTWIGANQMGPVARSRLRAAAMLNFGVFLMVVFILILQVMAE